MPKFIPSNIPEELKSESFMLWRYEERDGRMTKPPLNPHTGFRGDVTDPIQWADYDAALSAHQSGRYRSNGISVVVHPNSELVGLDLDHCIVDGKFSEEAQEILDGVCSYSEISPSGEGIRIFLYGKLPEKGRRRGPIECYGDARHLTVTGNHIRETPKDINRDQEVIDWFHQKFIAGPEVENSTQIKEVATADLTGMIQTEPASDALKLKGDEIIQQILSSKQKEKFERLYEGNTAGYASSSEADLALCSILSFWTGRNFKLIDSIFRQSSLFRLKWDEKHFSDGRTYGQETISKAIESCSEVYTPSVPSSINEIRDFLYKQERGDAELLSTLFNQEFLYDHIAQCWLRYENGVWNQDQEKQTLRIAVEGLTRVYLDASLEIDQEITLLIAKKKETNKERIRCLERIRDDIRERVRKLNNRNRISNVLKMAESWLPTSTWKFDSDPMKLNLANGIYDLNAHKLEVHSHEHLCLKQSKVAFEKGTTAERWIDFVNTIFNGDQELIRFVRQAIGFSLSGLSDLQALIFCYGSGANGKSTFFGVLRQVLGDYYQGIQVETLLAKNFQSSSEHYELARVKGARIVVSDEVPEGRKLNESLVKNLTGGDQIHARNPYEKPFSFDPTHTLWMYGNHKPVISGMDHGIWRRIYLVPFTVKISDDQIRPQKDLWEEFRRENSGILEWALEGWQDYQSNGLVLPEAVRQATSEYKSESDTLETFINENCIINSEFKIHTAKLFQLFKDWARENNETDQIRSSRAMIKLLRNRGYIVEAGSQNKHFVHGLGCEAEQSESWVN
jgi:putative DNA primase/helicase